MTASVNNYWIGKGVVSFKVDGEETFRDVGNVPEFEFTPEIETLEHFSSREGVRTKDLTVVLEKSGTLRMVMEEATAENLAMAVLGTVEEDTAGTSTIEIFATEQVSGELKFTGTNAVGQKFLWHFLKVDFIPGASISLISDEWGRLEVTGEVAAVDGSFGTVTEIVA